MPWYETYFMVHRKVSSNDLRGLVTDCVSKMTGDGGAIFKFNDFGWRHSGDMISRSGVGKFQYGRWLHFFWAGHPKSVKQSHNVLRHNTAVTRFITFKTTKPSCFSHRDTFYLNPSAYTKKSAEETQHPKIDYSV